MLWQKEGHLTILLLHSGKPAFINGRPSLPAIIKKNPIPKVNFGRRSGKPNTPEEARRDGSPVVLSPWYSIFQ